MMSKAAKQEIEQLKAEIAAIEAMAEESPGDIETEQAENPDNPDNPSNPSNETIEQQLEELFELVTSEFRRTPKTVALVLFVLGFFVGRSSK